MVGFRNESNLTLLLNALLQYCTLSALHLTATCEQGAKGFAGAAPGLKPRHLTSKNSTEILPTKPGRRMMRTERLEVRHLRVMLFQ